MLSGKTSGNGLKAAVAGVDITMKIFTIRFGRHWHKFDRMSVDSSSIKLSKTRLDGALNSLVYWKVSLFVAGDWNKI